MQRIVINGRVYEYRITNRVTYKYYAPGRAQMAVMHSNVAIWPDGTADAISFRDFTKFKKDYPLLAEHAASLFKKAMVS